MIGSHPTSPWGRGGGVLSRVAPGARVLAWLLLMSCCLMARPTSIPEIILVVAALSAWAAATGTPVRTLRRFVVLGLVFFLPFFIFIPWTGSSDTTVRLLPFMSIRSDAWIAPATILLRGTCCLLLGAGLTAVLSESDLHRVVSRLPAPGIFPVMIHQIMRFLAPLVHEGINISRAVVLRGGTVGWRNGIKVARTLPIAWLPRVVVRSMRVSMAMEVRGYHGQIMATQARPWRTGEVSALLVAALFPVAAIVLRGLT